MVYYIDPRVTESARVTSNLGKVKSDKADAHLLASAPWDNEKSMERKPHIRDSVSSLTRLLESVKKNVTRISNTVSADLAEVFPEFLDFFPDITSSTALGLLEKYSTPENLVKSGLKDVFSAMKKCSRNHHKAEEEKDFLRREDGKRGAVSRFRAIEGRIGKIAVITDLKVSGEVVYDMLKTRVDIEQAYDNLKNTMHADRTYVRDDYQMQGWMFVNFIALMLHYRIYNLLRKREMLRHYSQRDVIEHLERISRLKIGDEWKYSEIPKKSRKIMEELDLHIVQMCRIERVTA